MTWTAVADKIDRSPKVRFLAYRFILPSPCCTVHGRLELVLIQKREKSFIREQRRTSQIPARALKDSPESSEAQKTKAESLEEHCTHPQRPSSNRSEVERKTPTVCACVSVCVCERVSVCARVSLSLSLYLLLMLV